MVRGSEIRRRIQTAAAILAASFCCLFTIPAHAQDMSFRRVTVRDNLLCRSVCPEAIVANGRITGETAEQLEAILGASRSSGGRPILLFLNSPGGSVLGSMKLGVVLRAVGAVVIVALPSQQARNGGRTRFTAARCYSSCVYAFMGGGGRVVPRGSRVGVHRMHRMIFDQRPTGRVREFHLEYASELQVDALRHYAAAMGINPDLIALAERFSPLELHVLSQRDMRRFGLARGSL